MGVFQIVGKGMMTEDQHHRQKAETIDLRDKLAGGGDAGELLAEECRQRPRGGVLFDGGMPFRRT